MVWSRWVIGAAMMLSTAAEAQMIPAYRPAKTAAVQHRPIYHMAAKGFKLVNHEPGATTFLLLNNPSVRGNGMSRTILPAGSAANYLCGTMSSPCYVRFAARGGVENVEVQWRHVYEFAGQGATFDLYDLTPGQ